MMKLLCPISRKLPTVPIRGQNCTHLECFDLVSWLSDGSRRATDFPCPICGRKLSLHLLRLDSFFLTVLKSVGNSTSCVEIKSNGEFRPTVEDVIVIEDSSSTTASYSSCSFTAFSYSNSRFASTSSARHCHFSFDSHRSYPFYSNN
ncbi:hypothetical protein BC829DRAFT_116147 [Chytridium lagenaria]|nr:hypothetical protein BC829DRAFT_116147 [Chytridium lagenaria]